MSNDEGHWPPLPASAGDCLSPVQHRACDALMHGYGGGLLKRQPVLNSIIM